MKDLLNERQQKILNHLQGHGEVKVTELKEAYRVTEMTVRRDLEKLEQFGHAKRTFGGAILASKDVALRERTVVMAEEKKRIGRLAASLIEEGDSVFMDGGSTTMQIALSLPVHYKITVVTNALNVAAELLERSIPTIVLGGILLETTNSMVGPIAVENIGKMAFDKVFLGATGMNAVHGFSNSNMYESEVKRAAIQKARHTYVVIDRSKFGERSLVSFAEISQITDVITDRTPEGDLLAVCIGVGIHIHQAE